MSPPVGTLFVAWSDDVVVDAWLRRASPALSESEREMYRQALGAIRRDGYGLLVGTLAPEPTDAAAGSSPPAVPGDLRRFVHDLRMGLGAEDLPPPTNEQCLALGASVFDADGEVTLMISLHGFDRLTAADFDDCTRQLAAPRSG